MNDFNFFRQYAQKLVVKKKTNYAALIVLLLVLIVVAIGYLETTYLIDKTAADKELSRVVDEKARIDAIFENSNYTELSEQLAQIMDYSVIVSQMREVLDYKNILSSKQMQDIASIMPKNVSITTLSYNLENISMQGNSPDRVKIAEFEHNLKNLDYTATAFVSEIIETDHGFTFIMSAQLKDGDANEVEQ